jgi:chromosome partitioning protein
MRTISFFGNKGGVGTTTLIYHLSWMLQEMGISTVALDLDPQADLTAAFLSEERLEVLWEDRSGAATILGAIEPLGEPPLEEVASHLALVPGTLGLSQLEDRLAEAWPRCLSDTRSEAQGAFRLTTAFYQVALRAAGRRGAEVVLIDVGPNLGPLSRAAWVASDGVALPLGADLYSLQALRNLGPALRSWREGWTQRRAEKHYPPDLKIPSGAMLPAGYIVLQARAYQRWVERIPGAYHHEILGEPAGTQPEGTDPHRLAVLKHYRSLMSLAQEARKPMFLLKPADGAIGSHAEAVRDCYRDFQELAVRILDRIAPCSNATPKAP